jgi:hypothetical protein
LNLTATPWKQSGGHCDCCGNESKTVWGDLSVEEGTLAVYYVQWTVGSPDHQPNIDLVLGRWGDGASPEDRFLVSLLYDPKVEGGSFMVIDSEGRPADSRGLCGRALRKVEVIGTPLADEVFSMVDAIWRQDSRIDELKSFTTS